MCWVPGAINFLNMMQHASMVANRSGVLWKSLRSVKRGTPAGQILGKNRLHLLHMEEEDGPRVSCFSSVNVLDIYLVIRFISCTI